VVLIRPSGSTETVGVLPTVGSTDQVVITRATANIASPMPNRVRMWGLLWLCGRELTLSNYPHTSFDCALPLCRASQEDAPAVPCITKTTIFTVLAHPHTWATKRRRMPPSVHNRGYLATSAVTAPRWEPSFEKRAKSEGRSISNYLQQAIRQHLGDAAKGPKNRKTRRWAVGQSLTVTGPWGKTRWQNVPLQLSRRQCREWTSAYRCKLE